MLAVDPDEFEAQTYQIEALLNQNDDLQAALAASQSCLDSKASTIKGALRNLAGIKAGMAGLHLGDLLAVKNEISSLRHDIDAVVTALQQEVVT